MSRLIKFKVFCKKHNRWEYYTLGDLICGATTKNNGEGGKFNDETWLQFTGLKDRNGVEIYEGDILEYETREVGDENFITFKDGSFMLTRKDKTRFFPYHSEVIGNIHDYKDLLTK